MNVTNLMCITNLSSGANSSSTTPSPHSNKAHSPLSSMAKLPHSNTANLLRLSKANYLRSHQALSLMLLLLTLIVPQYLQAANLLPTTYKDEFGIVYELYDDNTAIVKNAANVKVNNSNLSKPGYVHIKSPFTTEDGLTYIVKGIADNAFYTTGFPNAMQNLRIDDGVEIIGSKAFIDCTKLTTINLPSSLKSIGATAFEGCSSLKTITCAGYTLPTVVGGDFTYIKMSNINLLVPENYSHIYNTPESPFEGANIQEKPSSSLGTDRPELIIDKSSLVFEPGKNKELSIKFDNSVNYTGFQVDIFLPEGITLTSTNDIGVITYTGSSTPQACYLEFENVSNNSLRILSTNNSSIYQITTILTLPVEVSPNFQGGEIWFKDLKASNSDFKIKAIDKCYMATVPEVEVASISLDKTSVSLKATETQKLVATVNPTNATNKKISWTSSNTSVATVSADGVVTAVSVGETTITATSNNGKTATCKVTVSATPAESVAITAPSSTTLKPSDTLKLTASVLPATATDKTVTWTSSNTAIATVASDGTVTAVKGGSVEITASCGSVSDKISLKILTLIEKIELNATTSSVEKGKAIQLAATYTPSSPDKLNLQWSSSNVAVATVDATGKVTGIMPGDAIITVKDTETGKSASCNLTVTDIMYGDANNDGLLIINDVTLIVDYILERNPANFVVERADVDHDGVIDIFDVTKTLELVMQQTSESVSHAFAALNTRSPNEVVSIGLISGDENGLLTVPVRLQTQDIYNGMQFDMVLPDGWTLGEIKLAGTNASKHITRTGKLAGNVTRVAIYSLSGAPLDCNATLVEMQLVPNDGVSSSSESTLELTNTIASMADGGGIAVGDSFAILKPVSSVESVDISEYMSVSVVGGGIQVNGNAGDRVEVYSLAGVKILSTVTSVDDFISLPKGFYIVRVTSATMRKTESMKISVR